MKNIRGALFVLSLSIILLFNSTTIAQAKATTVWVCPTSSDTYYLIEFFSLKRLNKQDIVKINNAFFTPETKKEWETKILNAKNCKGKIEKQTYKKLYRKLTNRPFWFYKTGQELFRWREYKILKSEFDKLSKKYNEYPLKNFASTTQIAKKEPTENQQVVKSALPECKGNDKNISKYSSKYLKKARKWTNCHGTIIGKNGPKYVGEFQGGGLSGQGTYTFGDGEFAGDKYVGEFLKSKRSGLGTYTFANGDIDHGIWAQGKLIERIETEIKVAKKEPTQTQQVAKKEKKKFRFVVIAKGIKGKKLYESGNILLSSANINALQKCNTSENSPCLVYSVNGNILWEKNIEALKLKGTRFPTTVNKKDDKKIIYCIAEHKTFSTQYFTTTWPPCSKGYKQVGLEEYNKFIKGDETQIAKKEPTQTQKVAKKKTGIFWKKEKTDKKKVAKKTEQSWKCKLFGLCGPKEKTQQVAKKKTEQAAKKKTEQVAKKIINIYCVKNNYSAIRMEKGEKPNCKNGEFKVVKNEYLLLETVYDSIASYFDLNDPNEVALFDRRVRDIFKTTHQDFNKLTDTQQVAKIESTKKTFNLLDLLKKEEKKITIKEVLDLGKYTEFNAYPEGMLKEFKNCKKMFCRGKVAGKRVYEIFAKRSELWHQRHPGDIIHGMAWFEIFYLEKLRKNEKQITRYIKNGPKGYSSKNIMDKMVMRKDISSLHGLIKTNKGRIKMREALGLSLNDDLETVLKRHWLLGDFLNKDKLKVKKVKINSDMKKRKKLLAEYKSALTRYKNKLEEERRATN